MRTSILRPLSVVGLLAFALGGGGSALGQAVNIAPAPVPTVDATPQFVPVWKPGAAPRNIKPDHPPIEEIPDAPLPRIDPDQLLLPAMDQSVGYYNADTGEWRVMDPGDPDAAPLRSAPPPSVGVPVFRGNEAQRSNSTLSAVAAMNLGGFPLSANCRIISRFLKNDGTSSYARCSASMQDAGVVLTAAHCIINRDADYSNNRLARETWVYPAWDGAGNSLPANDEVINVFGWARSAEYIWGQAYLDSGAYDRDVAALRLNRVNTRNIGMLTNWYGWARNVCTSTLDVYNYSYPAETVPMAAPGPYCTVAGLHTGRQMYFWSGRANYCPGTTTPNGLTNQFRFTIDPAIADNALCTQPVWGGMSGGGLYYISNAERYAVAVCSHGPVNYRAISYCAFWPEFTTALDDLKTSTRSTTFDAEALKYRISGATTFPAGSQISTASCIVTNPTNNDPPNRTYTIRYYLSVDNDIAAGDTLLATHTFTHDFPPLGSLYLSIAPFTVPANTPVGNYWIGAILDNATDGNTDNNDTDTWDAQRVTVQPCVLPAPPAGLAASDGVYCDRVNLSWNAVGGATLYRVYRHTVNNQAAASELIATAATGYNDSTAVAGTTYYYWIRAQSDCGLGAFGGGDTGFRLATPPAPTGLSAGDGTSCTGVSVSWNAVPGATQYQVYRNSVNNGATAGLLGSTASPPYTDSTAAVGTVYYYFVRASNACGTGPLTAGDAGRRRSPPLAPTGIAASNGTLCAGVRVQWTPSADTTFFRIFRNTVNNPATAAAIATVTVGPYVDATAALGTTYYYWVKSLNGCGESGFSTSDAGYKGNPPGAPTGVNASDGALCTPSVTITWNDLSDATGYEIWRNTSNNSASASLIATVSAPPYEDFTAGPGVTYYYWVKTLAPCISGGISGFSAVNSGSRGVATGAPTGVNATDGTRCRSVTVFWNATPGATGYQVFRNSTNNAATATFLGGIASPPYIDNSVVGTTVYWYFVKASNSCGLSAASAGNSGFAGNAFAVDAHPASITVASGDAATFFANAGGVTGIQWRKDGVPLVNGDNISGANARTLIIDPATPADQGSYTCAFTSPCGNGTSNPATLTVTGIACPADFNQDGGIDGADVDAFFDAWEAGDISADVNQDGGVDGADVDYFFAAWEAGGCG